MMKHYQADPVTAREKQRARYHADIERSRKMEKERYKRDRPKRIALATESAHRRRKRIAESERCDRGITTLALRDRDGSRCYICRRKMIFRPGKQGKYNPRRASIEHLVPIHQGGLHIWENVVLTCLGCNLSRPKDGDGAQLLLIG